MSTSLAIFLAACAQLGLTTSVHAKDKVLDIGTTTIVGKIKEQIMQNVGAAHRIDKKALKTFDSSDPHEVLSQAPGVYVRSEDGYGLRPNIAIRGVRAERSQNVTIMEDGSLIVPAPYSAPAAYYFPNVSRMKSVEVFKGPSSIKYGPRTVGGAINMTTKDVSMKPKGELTASYGSNNRYKLEGFYTSKLTETLGFAADGLLYGADGFKTIDGSSDGNTGFERKDVNVKFKWLPDTAKGGYDHVLTLKLGYADEVSNETYLGLTDADFKADPYRRYASSALDKFTSKHMQAHLIYSMFFPVKSFLADAELTMKAYHNRFERDWSKVDGFANTQGALFGGGKLFDTLHNTADNSVFYDLLRGKVNTSSLDVPYLNLGLDITNNARSYTSTGFETVLYAPLVLGDIEHELETGLRIHRDTVERNHHTRGYAMENQKLVHNGFSGDKLVNEAQSDAVSAFALNTMTLSLKDKNDLKVSAGLRYEAIESTLETKVNNFVNVTDSNDLRKSTNTESALLAGAGAYLQLAPTFGVLAGLHQGFSPAGPGLKGQIADPEKSLNYEAGVRYLSKNQQTSAELVGFYSDYDNLIGRARSSSGSNKVGASYNGGAVDIYGAELNAEHVQDVQGYKLPVQLTYTYTHAEFASGFTSSFREWGEVSKGFEMPYVPKHKARLQVGVESPKTTGRGWDAHAAMNFVGEMREVAGKGRAPKSLTTKDTMLVDLVGTYHIDKTTKVSAKLENAFDNQNIASRRPFGARPVKPRTVSASVTYKF